MHQQQRSSTPPSRSSNTQQNGRFSGIFNADTESSSQHNPQRGTTAFAQHVAAAVASPASFDAWAQHRHQHNNNNNTNNNNQYQPRHFPPLPNISGAVSLSEGNAPRSVYSSHYNPNPNTTAAATTSYHQQYDEFPTMQRQQQQSSSNSNSVFAGSRLHMRRLVQHQRRASDDTATTNFVRNMTGDGGIAGSASAPNVHSSAASMQGFFQQLQQHSDDVVSSEDQIAPRGAALAGIGGGASNSSVSVGSNFRAALHHYHHRSNDDNEGEDDDDDDAKTVSDSIVSEHDATKPTTEAARTLLNSMTATTTVGRNTESFTPMFAAIGGDYDDEDEENTTASAAAVQTTTGWHTVFPRALTSNVPTAAEAPNLAGATKSAAPSVCCHTTTVVGDFVVVIGGATVSNYSLDTYALHMPSQQWYKLGYIGGGAPRSRVSPTACLMRVSQINEESKRLVPKQDPVDVIVVYGGCVKKAASDSGLRVVTVSWLQSRGVICWGGAREDMSAASPTHRKSHAAFMRKGAMIVLMGRCDNVNTLDDMWELNLEFGASTSTTPASNASIMAQQRHNNEEQQHQQSSSRSRSSSPASPTSPTATLAAAQQQQLQPQPSVAINNNSNNSKDSAQSVSYVTGVSFCARWREVKYTQTRHMPAARHGHSAVYNEDTDRAYMFGGDTQSGELPEYVANDLWEFDFATSMWREIVPSAVLAGCQRLNNEYRRDLMRALSMRNNNNNVAAAAAQNSTSEQASSSSTSSPSEEVEAAATVTQQLGHVDVEEPSMTAPRYALSGDVMPSARYAQVAWLEKKMAAKRRTDNDGNSNDDADDCSHCFNLYVHGGDNHVDYYSDVWRIQLSADGQQVGNWECVVPDGSGPAGRSGHQVFLAPQSVFRQHQQQQQSNNNNNNSAVKQYSTVPPLLQQGHGIAGENISSDDESATADRLVPVMHGGEMIHSQNELAFASEFFVWSDAPLSVEPQSLRGAAMKWFQSDTGAWEHLGNNTDVLSRGLSTAIEVDVVGR